MKLTAAFAMISALSLAACGKSAAVPADSASAAATQQVPAAAPAVPAESPAATTAIPTAAAAPRRAATTAAAASPATKPTPVEVSAPARSDVKPPAVTPPPAAAVAADDSTGKVWYEENCRKCHGARGVPSKVMQTKFPKLAAFDAAFFAVRSNDSVVTALTNGVGEGMRTFKEKLTHAQMVSVASYIRTFVR